MSIMIKTSAQLKASSTQGSPQNHAPALRLAFNQRRRYGVFGRGDPVPFQRVERFDAPLFRREVFFFQAVVKRGRVAAAVVHFDAAASLS